MTTASDCREADTNGRAAAPPRTAAQTHPNQPRVTTPAAIGKEFDDLLICDAERHLNRRGKHDASRVLAILDELERGEG